MTADTTMSAYVLGKRRNDYGKQIRKAYESHQTEARRCDIADLVLVRSEYSNTITTLTKDNLICVIDFCNTQEE